MAHLLPGEVLNCIYMGGNSGFDASKGCARAYAYASPLYQRHAVCLHTRHRSWLVAKNAQLLQNYFSRHAIDRSIVRSRLEFKLDAKQRY